MSHFTQMRTKIRDEDLLIRCLREMGYEVQKGGTIRGFQGTRSVDVAVRMKQGYDVGFVREADGTYAVLADWWGLKATSQEQFSRDLHRRLEEVQERIKKEIEEMQRRVRREYALKASLAKLREQGFQVIDQRTEADGTVRILARRWR